MLFGINYLGLNFKLLSKINHLGGCADGKLCVTLWPKSRDANGIAMPRIGTGPRPELSRGARTEPSGLAGPESKDINLTG